MKGGIKMPLPSLDEITFLRKLQKVNGLLVQITNNELVDNAPFDIQNLKTMKNKTFQIWNNMKDGKRWPYIKQAIIWTNLRRYLYGRVL